MATPIIKYNNKKFQFQRRLNRYSYSPVAVKLENDTLSGVKEVVSFFNRHRIRVGKDNLTPGEMQQLIRWWKYARDGSSFSFEYDPDIGLYLNFEDSQIKTNDDVSGTFSRTGTAYEIDPSTGLVTQVADGTPRFEEGKFGTESLLLESASTNYCQYSENPNAAGWGAFGFITVSGSAVTYLDDPEGNNDAYRLDSAANGDYIQYDTGQAIGTDDGVFSVWLRSLDAEESVTIALYSTTAGLLASSNITVTPEWQRFYVGYNSTGSVAGNWRAHISLNNAGSTVFMWGAQIEAGRQVPSGYIPTNGATASRNIEYVNIIISSDDYGHTQGSVSFWIYPNFSYDDGQLHWIFRLKNNSTGYDFIRIVKNAAGHLENRMYYADNSSPVQVSGLATYLTKEQWHQIVFTYDTTISNGINVYVDGVLQLTSTNLPFNPVQNVNRVFIAHTGNYSDFKIDDLCIWKKVLTAQEVSAIYNSGKALGIGRNRWSNVRTMNTEIPVVYKPGTSRKDFDAEFEEVLT